MGLSVVTPYAESEVLAILSVAELKANQRITHAAEDTPIADWIYAAYDWLAGSTIEPDSGWLNRTLLTTTYKLTLPGFQEQEVYSSNGVPASRWIAANVIRLPKPPLVSVTHVKYRLDGVLTTVDAADYVVKTDELFGTVTLGYQETWPSTIDTHPGAVEIQFVAGYGLGAAVKKLRGIQQAMKLLAGDAYQNREDTYAEPRLVAVNRKILNGVTRYAGRYRIVNRHA